MVEHGLTPPTWRFELTRAVTYVARCVLRTDGTGTIRLSMVWAAAGDAAWTEQILLHEIAHGLAGPGLGHGPEFLTACARVGCVFTEPEAPPPPGTPALPYVATCSCGATASSCRKPRRPTPCPGCSHPELVWSRHDGTIRGDVP